MENLRLITKLAFILLSISPILIIVNPLLGIIIFLISLYFSRLTMKNIEKYKQNGDNVIMIDVKKFSINQNNIFLIIPIYILGYRIHTICYKNGNEYFTCDLITKKKHFDKIIKLYQIGDNIYVS